MQCKNCSAENPDTNNYCGNCGMPFGEGITLRDLIKAGYVKVGESINCKVKGEDAEATVLADGRVQWGDKVYDSPYLAIEAMRGYRCDSWSCWKGRDSEGKSKPLASLRSSLQRAKRG